MKTLKITWVGSSEKGNWYFRGTLELEGFIKSYLIQVTEAKASELEVGTEISVPKSLLKD